MEDDPVWKALADATRREILDLLRIRPRTTGELTERFEMTRYGVMKHLAVLVEANLVLVRRRGRQRWNHLNAVPLQEAIERWAGPYQRAMASSLLRLRQISEREGEGVTMGEQISEQVATVARTVQLEQEISIGATPDQVFEALTARTDEWWDTGFRQIENSTISIESQIGGRMVERDGNRAVIWATVTGIEPGKFVELTGPLGMGGATIGVLRLDLELHDGTTVIQLSHHVMGDVDETTRSNYAGGWQHLLGTRLKELVEAS